MLSSKAGSSLKLNGELIRMTSANTDDRTLRLALDEGWIIAEATHLLAHGANDEGRGYLLTLMHPRRLLNRQMMVPASPEIEALLNYQMVPMASLHSSTAC